MARDRGGRGRAAGEAELHNWIGNIRCPALVIGVTEIGEERYRRTGKPMPHLHLTHHRAEVDWKLYEHDLPRRMPTFTTLHSVAV